MIQCAQIENTAVHKRREQPTKTEIDANSSMFDSLNFVMYDCNIQPLKPISQLSFQTVESLNFISPQISRSLKLKCSASETMFQYSPIHHPSACAPHTVITAHIDVFPN